MAKPEDIGNVLIENVITKYCIPEYIIMDQDSSFMSSLMNYLFKEFDIKIKKVALFNHQSLQAEHGIKSLSNILTKHLTNLGQMCPKYLPLATFAHNMFNTPNTGHYSACRLVFGRKPRQLLNLDTMSNINVSVTFKDFYEQLINRLRYLHTLLQDFNLKRLAMMNKDRAFSQNYSGDLVYIISLLMSQLHTASRKVLIKYVGSVVIYKIIDPHNYLLMTLDGKILQI